MRQPGRQRFAGIVLTILGYFFVFGQSFAHGYAHLELAHHTEHHADAVAGHEGAADHHDVPVVSDSDDASDHPHATVDDGVAAKTVFTILAIVRPILADEFEQTPRRTLPPEESELVPRHSLHTTAPPNLRAPPVG